MTEEQFEKAIEIHEALEVLDGYRDEITANNVSLTFVHKTGRDGIKECNILEWELEPVREILEKHSKQIVAEIDSLIETTRKQIETL